MYSTVHAAFGAKAEKPKHQEIPDARIGHLGMYPSTCRALEVCIDVTMYLSKYKLSVNSVFSCSPKRRSNYCLFQHVSIGGLLDLGRIHEEALMRDGGMGGHGLFEIAISIAFWPDTKCERMMFINEGIEQSFRPPV